MATMPREAALEFYLDGWTSIRARQTAPITITRGRQDWASDVSPARFHAILDNTAGDLDPDNPLGAYYGQLNRNTPLRYSYILLRDTFGRTATDSWGSTTPDGVEGHTAASLAYTLSGTAANFDVAAGVGTMVIASASDKRRAYLAGAVHRAVQVSVDIPTFSAPASGDNVQGIMLRGTSTSDYVAVDVNVTAAGVVRIAIRDTDDTTYLVSPTTVAGVVRTSAMRLTVQVEGDTIRGKIWNTSGSEPFGWHATARSTAIARTGWIGLRAATGTGNTNVTFTWDTLVIASPRFFGGAASITPKADSTASNHYVVLEGAGVLRRLERNKSPARSAPRVYIPTTAAVAYWPLEGGSLSTAGQPAVGTGQLILGNNVGTLQAPSQYFGKGDLGSFLNPGMTLRGGSDFAGGPVSMPGFVDEWAVDQIRAGGKDLDTHLFVFTTTGSWDLKFNGATSEIQLSNPAGTPLTAQSVPQLYDGDPHHVRLYTSQNGGNVGFIVDIDGNNTYSNGAAWAGTLGSITHVFIQDNSTANHSEGWGFAHLTVYAEDRPLVDFENPVLGWAAEAAGRRLERLCEENSIPFSHIGDLDETAMMGPQRPIPLAQLLAECADADFGTLAESRMTDGLVYRTGASLYNQAAGITLDYSAGQVTGEFDPAKDDQDTRNDVTAKRVDGGDHRETQTSGPRNTADPADDPDGVGIYDASVTVNVATDAQLPDVAGWALHLGTTPEVRAPEITITAGSPNITAALDAETLSLDLDDRIVVENLTSRRRYEPVSQLGRGYTETLDTIFNHTLRWVGTPEAPYRVFELDDTELGRVDTAGSVLAVAVDSDDTALSVATTSGPLWTTAAGDLPMDVMIGGERMSVTDIDNEVFTYIAAGTAAQADNASVTPGLPTEHTAGDLLLILASIHNSGTGTPNKPAGYTTLLDMGNVRLFGKPDSGSESAPTVSFSNSAAGPTGAQMACVRSKIHNIENLVAGRARALNPSAQNVAYPGLSIGVRDCLVLAIAWKRNNWGSVDTLAGWTEIGEFTTFQSGIGQGTCWDYKIQTTAANLAAGSFTVNLGAADISRAALVAIRADRQAFTVTRSANEVVKSHAAGAAVAVADPIYLGL